MSCILWGDSLCPLCWQHLYANVYKHGPKHQVKNNWQTWERGPIQLTTESGLQHPHMTLAKILPFSAYLKLLEIQGEKSMSVDDRIVAQDVKKG